jgi:hypothetical protein
MVMAVPSPSKARRLAFFIVSETEGIHLLMIAMTTLLISMRLYLIFLFWSPFSGDFRVSDQPFRFVKKLSLNFYGFRVKQYNPKYEWF